MDYGTKKLFPIRYKLFKTKYLYRIVVFFICIIAVFYLYINSILALFTKNLL